jgi:RNA polymerase sigma-70 factor (ECF subfamily)
MLYEFDHQQIATLVQTCDGPTDEQLMGLVKGGDESALAMLYHRHTAILRTVISRVVHNDADTDDLLQECFIELWKRAATYDEAKGKLLGWLITLARRRAIDRVRRRQAYSRAEERLIEHSKSDGDDCHNHVEDEANASDCSQALKKALSELPDAQREALQMAYYQGLSQREIAAKTGIPLGTIKTRLELAIRKVRVALLAIGGAEEWSMARC